MIPLAFSAGLQGQFAITNPEMSPASVLQLSSGESDPRMELLRFGFDIKIVAGMSRGDALYYLSGVVELLDTGIEVDKLEQWIDADVDLSGVVELIDTGIEVDKLEQWIDADVDLSGVVELIDTGIEVDKLVELIDAEEALDIISEAGVLANLILTDTNISSNPLDEDRIFTRGRLMSNRFSVEVVKLVAANSGNELIAENIVNAIDSGKLTSSNEFVGELVESINDSNNTNLLNTRQFRDRKNRDTVGNIFGLTTDDFTAYGGKNMTIEAGSTVDVRKWVGKDAQSPYKTKVLAFTAGGDMRIKGDVTFTNGGHEVMDHTLALGAADDLKIAEGSTVKYDGSNFGLGAGKSIRIVKVSLETKDHLGLGTLDDLIIQDSSIRAGAGNRALLYAQNKMDVNGLTFSSGLGQVYMEATTMDLRNVDFPSGSEVRLISELGGIDGVYPNFGSSLPGRVNFIASVSYGGPANIMNDRPSFDQHGSRVSIESFGQ
ncbi:MAG: hypothetical protein HOD72_04435 [Opitutae bacterium]|nr:hypothetical protein [Opitutae bacterium]